MVDNRDSLFDKRTVDRNIKKGLISREEYDKHLGGLKDVEDNAEVIDFAPPEEEEAASTPAAAAAAPAEPSEA